MPKDCVGLSYKSETRIKWSSVSYKWTVKEISTFQNPHICTYFTESQPLLSPKFRTESNHVFQLKLFKVLGNWGEEDITCQVHLTNDSDNTTHAAHQMLDGVIEFGNAKNEILHWIWIGPGNLTLSVAVSQLNEFFNKLEIDELTIYCEIHVGTEQAEPLCPTPVWDESYLHRSVNENIEKFQGNQFLTDVDLEVSGKTFKGHKLILAAVSPVFEKMFQGNSHEHQNNRVIIEDVDADVFEELMTYIYSGQLPHLKEMSPDLLAVADKYSILPLLQICMIDLLENMSVDDAAATYVLADRHSLHKVKPTIINFMKKHFYEVAASAGWVSLGNHHPQLIKEIQDKFWEETV